MIASPCINICRMDAQTGLCSGCFRTIDEITTWSRCSEARRREILASITHRREEHEPSIEKSRSDSDSNG